jgi:hypothetical protein
MESIPKRFDSLEKEGKRLPLLIRRHDDRDGRIGGCEGWIRFGDTSLLSRPLARDTYTILDPRSSSKFMMKRQTARKGGFGSVETTGEIRYSGNGEGDGARTRNLQRDKLAL